jgi:hypothetical protein
MLIPYNFTKASLSASKGSNKFRTVNDPPNSRLTRDMVRQAGNIQGNFVTAAEKQGRFFVTRKNS